MKQRNQLAAWFESQVATEGVAKRDTLFLLVALKVLRALSFILGYWFFAAIVHAWMVGQSLTPKADLYGLATCLILACVFQLVVNWQTSKAKLTLLNQLEHRLLQQFQRQQHALIRHHSSFYWQTLWLKHIPAVVHWHFDYRVQQMVAVTVPVFTLVAILWQNSLIGLTLLITLPVVPLFMVIVGKGAASLHRKHFIALERLGSLFVDRLAALPLIASFRVHDKQQALITNASEQLNQRTMKVVGVAFLSTTVLDFFATLAVALIAVFIGFKLLGEFSLGPDISLHVGLWILLTAPFLLTELKALGQFYHQKAEAEAAQVALQDLLSLPEQHETNNAINDSAFQQFTLDHFVMHNPTLTAHGLTLARGDKIQLHGKSGAGKSVFMEALAGQLPATHKLPTSVAMLNQDVVVLPTSLKENLTLGAVYSDDAIWHVLAQVELTEWAQKLPQELATPMGEHPPLSGGQAQRLALARMLLQQVDVWLLDEPTAHLSTSQHKLLTRIIQHVCVDKTVLWASHKPLDSAWFTQHWQVLNGEVVKGNEVNDHLPGATNEEAF